MMAPAWATLLNQFLGRDGLIETVTLAYDELGPIVAQYLGGAVKYSCIQIVSPLPHLAGSPVG